MGDGPVSLLAVGMAAVVAGFYGGLLYAAGISAINLFSGYGHGDIFDIIILVICILVVGFTCYSISWRGKSSSLSKNGKKVRDMLYDTSGRYERCPKCTSRVDMEIGVCRFCGYDLFNGEYTYKRRSSEDQVRIDYAKDLQKKKFKK